MFNCQRDIATALGLANFLHEHLPNFAHKVAPLRTFSKLKPKELIGDRWKPEHQLAWDQMKEDIVSAVMLNFPVDGVPLELETDASDSGIGGALFQLIDGRKHYLMFFSKTLNKAQQTYTTPMKELLALTYSLVHFHDHLIVQRFTVHTDHKALIYMNTQLKLNSMLQRWHHIIAQFIFTITHVPGELNKLPDMWSRVHEGTADINYPAVFYTSCWKLLPDLFDQITLDQKHFEPNDVDAFASSHNAQLRQYWLYDKDGEAFGFDWSRYNE